MASITKLPNGRRLRFTLRNERKQIWLGKMNAADSDRVRSKVEDLVAAITEGRLPHQATSEWLAQLDDKFRKKLVSHGLCEMAERIVVPTIADLIDAYKAKKYDGYSERTIINHDLVFKNLTTFWESKRTLDTITEGDADDYRDWLMCTRRPKLNETSARKDCAVARKLMRYARRKRWIAANPFDEVPTSNVAGGTYTELSREASLAILRELRGTEWPLLFALARWGGLRVPSDVEGLRWSGVIWERRRFTFYAKKTKSWRTVPIFDELQPLFEQRHQAAECGEGDELVLPGLSTRRGSSLRKPLLEAIKRAGVDKWLDLWQNLRRVRENELLRMGLPKHVVLSWIGHSAVVADKHYLEVSDADFERALAVNF